jgi:hypothetical protein
MRRPPAASSVATLAVVFDLPVPPRNEWMAMILDIVGPPSVCGADEGHDPHHPYHGLARKRNWSAFLCRS